MTNFEWTIAHSYVKWPKGMFHLLQAWLQMSEGIRVYQSVRNGCHDSLNSRCSSNCWSFRFFCTFTRWTTPSEPCSDRLHRLQGLQSSKLGIGTWLRSVWVCVGWTQAGPESIKILLNSSGPPQVFASTRRFFQVRCISCQHIAAFWKGTPIKHKDQNPSKSNLESAMWYAAVQFILCKELSRKTRCVHHSSTSPPHERSHSVCCECVRAIHSWWRPLNGQIG